MLRRVGELLGRCKSKASVLPPTELYNEGWMLRLILDWFDRNRDMPHFLAFLPNARWYSEALLPSHFPPQRRGDPLAESFTHADGVIGHFEIKPGERGEAKLLPDARQFLVIEAKLGSSLSAGTKNAPEYDQAARNVACIAQMVSVRLIPAEQIDCLGFYVIAPQHQIDSGVFRDMVTKESISRKVAERVAQYNGERDEWLAKTFRPVLERIQLGLVSWESIIDSLPANPEKSDLRDFYKLCLDFNPMRGANSRPKEP